MDAASGAQVPADMEYIIRFRQTRKRYNIDFSTADPYEKEFVMRMAEKLAFQRA